MPTPLEVALRVPGEGADTLAALDAERSQGAGEAVDPLDDLAMAGARDASVGQRRDLAGVGEGAHPPQHVLEGELEVVLHQSGQHRSSCPW
ncbi:MAG: hypothetical protein ABSB73_07135 [Solirubrobacteraceae bacterium]